MALDNAKNFAKVTVSIGYNASATSIVLNSGNGALLPTAPFNLTWWNSTDYSDPSDDPNVEIVRCTGISTDTLTVTRGQESISASTKNTAGKTYKMIAGITAKVINTDAPATFEVQTNKDANSGYAGLDSGGLLKPAEFPSPTASLFGGVKALAAAATKYLTSIGTDGIPVAAQPSFTDLQSTLAGAQMPTTFTGSANGAYLTPIGQNILVAGSTVTLGLLTNKLFAMVLVHTPITIRKICFSVSTGVASSKVYIAIYDSTKTLIANSSNLGAASTSAVIVSTTLGTPVTLNPGTYYVFMQADTTGVSVNGIAIAVGLALANFNQPRWGLCANGISGAAVPGTLGALTLNNTSVLPMFLLEA